MFTYKRKKKRPRVRKQVKLQHCGNGIPTKTHSSAWQVVDPNPGEHNPT